MKKIFYGSVLVSLLLLGACSNDEMVNIVEETTTNTRTEKVEDSINTELSTLDLLETYISKVKFADNAEGSCNTATYSLSPYIFEDDTLMYVVNYDEGWDLLSTDKHTPIVLATSDTGSFNLGTMPDAMKDFIKGMAQDIKTFKCVDNSEEYYNDEWRALMTLSRGNNYKIIVKDYQSQKGSGPGGIGYWYYLGQDYPGTIVSDYSINHLITTHWHQYPPFDAYSPLKPNSSSEHYFAGCIPVALGQYLKFYHDKDGRQWAIPTVATLQANNTYLFSNYQNVMDNLESVGNNSPNTTPLAAKFIASLGQMLNTNYQAGGSSTTSINLKTVLNAYFYPYVYQDYNYSNNEQYVLSTLQSGYPIIVTATNSYTQGQHCFIIDKYRTIITRYHQYYGWVGEDDEGNPTNEFDALGHPLDFTYYKEEDYYHTTNKISMNWGYPTTDNNNYWQAYDNIEFTLYDTGWIVDVNSSDIKNFNSNRKIYHQ